MALDRASARRILDRLTYGPLPGQVDQLVNGGLSVWLNEQLSAPKADDPATAALLNAAQIPVARLDANGKPVVHLEPITYLVADPTVSWTLKKTVQAPTIFIPVQEVRAATLIRATASPYQLRELMVQFWHNHFSLDATISKVTAAMFAVYHRDVIRPNVFGNFKTMLLATAKSAAMLDYLNLRLSSRKQPNENYAREVIEQYTLGSGAYLGKGGDQPSVSTGYTDLDIQQAARALCGWTTANGTQHNASGQLPDDGSFLFNAGNHDSGAKKILGTVIPAGGVTEGEAFLSLIATHPATAAFVSAKMVRWLAGERPSTKLLAAAKATWIAGMNSQTQLAEVIRTIVTHPDFATAPVAKVKDPLRFCISLFRVSGVMPRFVPSLASVPEHFGFPFYTWPSPDGIPDQSSLWTSSTSLLDRWNIVPTLLGSGEIYPNKTAFTEVTAQGVGGLGKITAQTAIDFWSNRLLASGTGMASRQALVNFAAQADMFGPTGSVKSAALENVLRRLVAAIACVPEFQTI